jgi:uncharacterized protein (TIGR02145 family)
MEIKKKLFFVLLLVFTFLIQSCKNDQSIILPEKQNVTFSFGQKVSELQSSGIFKTKASEKQDARYVVVTIQNANGDVIYDSKKLELFNFNGSYISESLTLNVAAYKLTKFLVLDANNAVIFSTPLEGSTLASWVADPLPIDFVVVKDAGTKIVPEVLSTDNLPATDFGTATFDLNIITSFRLSSFIYDLTSANWIPSTSMVTVTGNPGNITLYNGSLSAQTNTISIKDGYDTYEVLITKAGYTPQSVMLTNAVLKTYTSTPLGLQLKALTTVTDIDGNVYKTVVIGNQTWMAENLTVTKYRDGTPIPNVTTSPTWVALTDGGWCYYQNNPTLGGVYGKLYNGYVPTDSRNIAPAGWHVPTEAEWETLFDYCGGLSGGNSDYLKEAGTTHWNKTSINSNKTGFTALPGGSMYNAAGAFNNIGTSTSFWSNVSGSFIVIGDGFGTCSFLSLAFGAYIRCVKD